MEKKPYRPRDVAQLAKYMVELTTGQRDEVYEAPPKGGKPPEVASSIHHGAGPQKTAKDEGTTKH